MNRKEGLELTLNSSAHKGNQRPQLGAWVLITQAGGKPETPVSGNAGLLHQVGEVQYHQFLSEIRLRVICDHTDKM